MYQPRDFSLCAQNARSSENLKSRLFGLFVHMHTQPDLCMQGQRTAFDKAEAAALLFKYCFSSCLQLHLSCWTVLTVSVQGLEGDPATSIQEMCMHMLR